MLARICRFSRLSFKSGLFSDPILLLRVFDDCQPQLNKAVKLEENGFGDSAELDRNLKDWILFSPSQFSSSDSARDNTGLGPFPEEGKNSFLDDIPFPTLDFPSDHAILSACLHPVGTRLI